MTKAIKIDHMPADLLSDAHNDSELPGGPSDGGGGMDGYAREADLRELRAVVETTLPHLATKTDVSDLRTELRDDIGNLKITALVAIGAGALAIIGAIGGATWTLVEKFWPLIEQAIKTST